MDWKQFEQLRISGFTQTRRGYDTREVDRFLETLADWLENEAATELGDEAVQRKLELVGKSTAHILLTTEKESQELRRTTQAECDAMRAQAQADAAETRRQADEYSATLRARTEMEAQQTRDEAAADARETVEEGNARRAAAETVVAELNATREAAVAQLEDLRGMLLGTITKHSSRIEAPAQRADDEPRRSERRKRANIAKATAEDEPATEPAEMA